MPRNVLRAEAGQGLVEYALSLVMITIVLMGILVLLGNQVSAVFSAIESGPGQSTIMKQVQE